MGELKILAATTNPGKVREIKKILEKLEKTEPPLKLLSLNELNITDACPETGNTFRENAIFKANFYSLRAKDWLTVAEDSGLSVEALHGEPGIYSARYAGNQADDEQNIARLLEKLKSVKNRKARFVSVVALSTNGRCIQSFEGQVEGLILDHPAGSHGFGYDPVFYYPPLNKTFAQLSTDEKNAISHRARAFMQLKQYLLGMPEL